MTFLLLFVQITLGFIIVLMEIRRIPLCPRMVLLLAEDEGKVRKTF